MFNIVQSRPESNNPNPTKSSPRLKLGGMKGKWGLLKTAVKERKSEFSKITKGGDAKSLDPTILAARAKIKAASKKQKEDQAREQKQRNKEDGTVYQALFV